MFFRGQNLKIQVEETLLHEESQNIPENTRRAPLTKKFKINKEKKDIEKATHTQKKRMINVVLTFKNQIVIMKTQYFSNMEAGVESNYIQSSWKRPQGCHSLHQDGEGDALMPVSPFVPPGILNFTRA